MAGIQIGWWDVALIAAVSTQSTLIAYLHDPRHKALVFQLPIPFTLAALSVGQPIDATNVVGLLVFLVFFLHSVRIMHHRLGVPIIPAIAIATTVYCILGMGLAHILPRSDTAFWIAVVAAIPLAVGLNVLMPERVEQGHRSTLPIWIKLPIIVAVIVFLIMIKKSLQGFTTFFPMVAVVGTYEARHSLWTITRRFQTAMFAFLPMLAVCRIAQGNLELGYALILGWMAFGASMFLIKRSRKPAKQAVEEILD